MALDMRALYYVALPTERSEADDVQRHEEDIKANENCLNQNFSALAQKIYEFEARIALLEAAAASNAGKTDTGYLRDIYVFSPDNSRFNYKSHTPVAE